MAFVEAAPRLREEKYSMLRGGLQSEPSIRSQLLILSFFSRQFSADSHPCLTREAG